MMTREEALRFAGEWAAVRNTHDRDRILAHYRDDFEMTSPFIVKRMGQPTGTLRGKEQVGAYWRRALDRIPDLHFKVLPATGSGTPAATPTPSSRTTGRKRWSGPYADPENANAIRG
jgi:hypothetical protein